MAVPTAYNPKRLADYFGRTKKFGPTVPSGTSSNNDGKVFYPKFGMMYKPTDPRSANQRLVKSLADAQAAHEMVMDKINQKDVDTFNRINKALTASREADPKDALGNSIPSGQTLELERLLKAHLARGAATGIKGLPTPAQVEKIKKEGAGGLGERPKAPAAAPIPQPPQATGDDLKVSRTAIPGKKMQHALGEVTLTGKQRTGPNGEQELEATKDGKTGWVPSRSLSEIKKKGRGLFNLEQYYAPPVGPWTEAEF